MDALDHTLVHSALADYVTGTTLQLVHGQTHGLDGAQTHAVAHAADLSAYSDDSVDALIAAWSVEHVEDALVALPEWRRVLREGGHVAVVLRDPHHEHAHGHVHSYTADAWKNVLHAVGGFELARVAELQDGHGWLVVAKRHAMSDLRTLLGGHGSALADAAQRGPEHRAELCFHFGTILLRAGELHASRTCFEAMLHHAPDNSEGLFGLGMCHALEKNWNDAVSWLTRAVEHDDDNSEAKRWLGLAQLELESTATDVAPQSLHGRKPEAPTD